MTAKEKKKIETWLGQCIGNAPTPRFLVFIAYQDGDTVVRAHNVHRFSTDKLPHERTLIGEAIEEAIQNSVEDDGD
jgi:hypothetical protein